jgi:hypothetical protein
VCQGLAGVTVGERLRRQHGAPRLERQRMPKCTHQPDGFRQTVRADQTFRVSNRAK